MGQFSVSANNYRKCHYYYTSRKEKALARPEAPDWWFESHALTEAEFKHGGVRSHVLLKEFQSP